MTPSPLSRRARAAWIALALPGAVVYLVYALPRLGWRHVESAPVHLAVAATVAWLCVAPPRLRFSLGQLLMAVAVSASAVLGVVQYSAAADRMMAEAVRLHFERIPRDSALEEEQPGAVPNERLLTLWLPLALEQRPGWGYATWLVARQWGLSEEQDDREYRSPYQALCGTTIPNRLKLASARLNWEREQLARSAVLLARVRSRAARR